MIPLKDLNPTKTTPFISISLIVLNGLVFLYELSLGRHLGRFFFYYGVVPGNFFRTNYWEVLGVPGGLLPVFASMFLHGGWLHFLGNMLYLWVFGDNVEDRLGHFRFLIFYLGCGIAATALHIFTNPQSMLPTVGASGAIAGVLGAYVVFYPRARVLALVPILFFFQLMELPALIFLGFWFVMQFFSGALSLASQAVGGTAWWAHIGGFVAGMAYALTFKRRVARRFGSSY
jgi:membrane associated rhomboid family serine protease